MTDRAHFFSCCSRATFAALLMNALSITLMPVTVAAASLGVDVFFLPSSESVGIAYTRDYTATHVSARLEQNHQTDSASSTAGNNATSILLSLDHDLSNSLTLLSSIGVRQFSDQRRTNTLRSGVDWLYNNTAWTAEIHYREFELALQRLNGTILSRDATSLGFEFAVLHFVTDILAIGARSAVHNPDINAGLRERLSRPRLQALLTPSSSDLLFALSEYEYALNSSVSVRNWLLSTEAGLVQSWLDDVESHYVSVNIDRSVGKHWHIDASIVQQFTPGDIDSTGIGIGARFRW